jgi:VWFA-related protein
VAGKTRIRTLLSTSEVAKVVFFVDGQERMADERAPFTATLELGDPPRPQEIRAVAYSAGDRALGEDRLLVNQEQRPFRVTITELEVGAGFVEIAGDVSVPTEETLLRVEVYLNETLVEKLAEASFATRFEAPGLGPEDFVRVVAYLASGESLEDVRLLAAPGAGERVEVNLVELFCVVTDDEGNPVKDLEVEDFTVLLKGKPQTPSSFRKADDVPLVLGLLVDTSESMWVLLPDTKKAAARFLSQTLIEGDQAFLVEFDNEPRLVQGVTGDLFEILQRFGRLRAQGATALYDSIVFSLLQFEGARGRRALVLLTDGRDFGSQLSPRRAVQYGKELGVPVYVLDLTSLGSGRPSLPKSDLDWITRNTGGRTFYIESLEQLDGAYAQINGELRNQYILAYAPGRELTDKELAALEVKVKGKGVSVRTVVGARDRR